MFSQSRMYKELIVLLPLVLFVSAQNNDVKPYFSDPAMQAELDRLIGEALDRDLSKNPNKKEYERYYRVRQFIMQNPPDVKFPDAKFPFTTTETPKKYKPTTPFYMSRNWLSNQQLKTWELSDSAEQPVKIQMQDKASNYREYPRLVYTQAE